MSGHNRLRKGKILWAWIVKLPTSRLEDLLESRNLRVFVEVNGTRQLVREVGTGGLLSEEECCQIRTWIDECFYRRELQTLSQYLALSLVQERSEQQEEDFKEMREIILRQVERSDLVAYFPQCSVLRELSDNMLYLDEKDVLEQRLEQVDVVSVKNLKMLVEGSQAKSFFLQMRQQCSLQKERKVEEKLDFVPQMVFDICSKIQQVSSERLETGYQVFKVLQDQVRDCEGLRNTRMSYLFGTGALIVYGDDRSYRKGTKRIWVEVSPLGLCVISVKKEFRKHFFTGGTVQQRVGKMFLFLYVHTQGEEKKFLELGTSWELPLRELPMVLRQREEVPTLRELAEQRLERLFGGVKRGPSRYHSIQVSSEKKTRREQEKLIPFKASDLPEMQRRRGVYLSEGKVLTQVPNEVLVEGKVPSLLVMLKRKDIMRENWSSYPEDEVSSGCWVYSERQFRGTFKELALCLGVSDFFDVFSIIMGYVGKMMNKSMNPVEEAVPVVLYPRNEKAAMTRTVGLFPITMWRMNKKGSPTEMEYSVPTMPIIVTVGEEHFDSVVTVTEDVPALFSSTYSVGSSFIIQKCARWLQMEFCHWRILVRNVKKEKIEGRLFWIVIRSSIGWSTRPFVIVPDSKRGRRIVDPLHRKSERIETDICVKEESLEWNFGFVKRNKHEIRGGCSS